MKLFAFVSQVTRFSVFGLTLNLLLYLVVGVMIFVIQMAWVIRYQGIQA
jgi:hypothetical protein